jgi:4a-hydroxytetrahydrobiopterin dehydratase
MPHAHLMPEMILPMSPTLTRTEASDAVNDLGWRYILGTLRTSVPVHSLAEASQVTASAVTACGTDADQHLRADLRPGRVVFTLQSLDEATVTKRDIELANVIAAAVGESGLRTDPDLHPGAPRSVQLLEIGIDAINIASIRPFWKAVLGYADEPGADGPEDALIDPLGQGPAIWFQQMDEPRAQRNRLHFDVNVPHDEAARRIEATLAAGGKLLYDAEAPSFWVLADPEGNEACVTTWQGRD